ncbi:MAG: hypothetical protein ABI867_32385 [Kofleriaceae bacterium]
MHRWALAVVVACSACDEGGTDSFESAGMAPATKPGSSGFSSDLAKSMGSPESKGSGSAEVKPETGSAAKPETGSADAGKLADAGSAKPVDAGTKPDTGSAAKVADAGSAKTEPPKPDTGKKPDKPEAGSASAIPAPPPINLGAPRVAVKPSAEVAAIKLSLSPNWDRDVGEAGTISLVVKVPGGKPDETRVFSFRYGYEEAKAPADRDAYKKWLADNKVLTVILDRQRGAAWYLEGTDGGGAPAFRLVVNYGGKKLICGGSLYKDVSSNQLGDIRDKTIIQAKEICESVAL